MAPAVLPKLNPLPLPELPLETRRSLRSSRGCGGHAYLNRPEECSTALDEADFQLHQVAPHTSTPQLDRLRRSLGLGLGESESSLPGFSPLWIQDSMARCRTEFAVLIDEEVRRQEDEALTRRNTALNARRPSSPFLR